MSDVLLWSIDETARQLDISARTVRRMLESGELPKAKIRGRVAIPVVAVREYVARQTDLAHNGRYAGPDVPGGNDTCGSVAKTEMVSTHDPTRRTTGHRISTVAAKELGVLLGFEDPRTEDEKQHSN